MNWLSIYPEIALLTMACVVTLIDLFVRDPMRRPTYWVTQLSLAVVAAMHFADFSAGLTVYAMDRMVVSDPLGHLLGFFACIAVIAVLVYSRAHAAQREMLNGEFFSLAMFSLLGILVMLSANNFLVIYLGLELMSLSLYALVALRRDHPPATEAAMKFFVLGALASGFLLYGLSMMYGATGSLDIPEVFKAIATGQINKTVLAFGLVFIVAGLAFKLSAVPFHMWVPDVYDGAPTPVTLLIGCAPEFAAFAITFRLLVEGMSGLAVDWQQMLIVVSIGSMALGNIAAIAQTNIKRMLAYSAIAHMGFMLLGFTPTVIEGNTYSAANGYSSALFYVVVYVFTTLGAFATILLLSRRGFEADRIDDFKGLSRRSPWFAGVMSLFMFSLAGVPPTVGFYAKLAVLQSIVTTNQPGYIALAVFAVLMSLVGAFYYIRIVKVMYFDEPADSAPIVAATDVRALLSLNGAAIVLFGILPGGLMALCTQAIVRALAT
ncbi:MAG TPA: NADH-quinone oxidoreductase subunit NuoN [Burkholderiaceae bacterium]|nr:NADH-quinone oxidoreductase subunit NuoN [Burkholderiaceae bacterium]